MPKVEKQKRRRRLKLIVSSEESSTRTIHDLFRQGDLVFGLWDYISEAVASLERQGYKNVVIRDLNLPLVEKVINGQITEEYRKSLTPEQRKHLAMLERHKARLVRPGGANPWPNSFDARRSIAIRRACKLAVREAAKEKRRIHFITDGMDFARVCKKPSDDSAISGGEVRTAYKTRVENNGFFIFYHEGKRVDPPWEAEAAALFKEFDEYRASKRAAVDDPEPTGMAASVTSDPRFFVPAATASGDPKPVEAAPIKVMKLGGVTIFDDDRDSDPEPEPADVPGPAAAGLAVNILS